HPPRSGLARHLRARALPAPGSLSGGVPRAGGSGHRALPRSRHHEDALPPRRLAHPASPHPDQAGHEAMSVAATRVSRLWLWGVGLFALLVRMVSLTAVLGLHSPIPHRFDDGIYHDLGRSIAAGQGMSFGGHPCAIVSPGYPAFIAASYAAFGVDPAGPRIVQAVLGAGTAVLLSLLTLELGL